MTSFLKSLDAQPIIAHLVCLNNIWRCVFIGWLILPEMCHANRYGTRGRQFDRSGNQLLRTIVYAAAGSAASGRHAVVWNHAGSGLSVDEPGDIVVNWNE